jgi:peptide/nickel transport system permease protein
MTGAAVPVVVSSRALRRRRARRRLLSRPLSVAGLIGVVIVVLVTILAPLIAPYAPNDVQFNSVLTGPFHGRHILGTDQLGRDELSRLIYGARASLVAGVLSTVLGTLVAIPLGLIAGYYGKWFDSIISRVVDIVLAFPFLVLAVGLAAINGASLFNAVIALGIAQIPATVRVVRGEVLATRELDYVAAEVVNGTPDRVILFRRILPNVLSPVVVQASVGIPSAIIGAAILSYLGLGVQPPTADWGSMLAQAQSYLSQAAWLGVLPGIAIFLTTMSFNLLGDGLRDALDTRITT